MKKRIIYILLIFLFTSNASAGLRALTHHSRANCAGFNETITWWAGHTFKARVLSRHYPLGKAFPNDNQYHTVDTGSQTGYRHAAYHANEAYPGDAYRVSGLHYMYVKGNPTLVQQDSIVDCSIYDGWWD